MSQTTKLHSNPHSRIALVAKNLAVPVTNALTTLLELTNINGVKRLWAEFLPTVHNFNAFEIQVKLHEDAPAYISLYTTGYASPAGILVAASGALDTLASGSTGWFGLDVNGLYAVRVQASSASAAGTLVDAYANASS